MVASITISKLNIMKSLNIEQLENRLETAKIGDWTCGTTGPTFPNPPVINF